jgi:outer membrane protein TolC
LTYFQTTSLLTLCLFASLTLAETVNNLSLSQFLDLVEQSNLNLKISQASASAAQSTASSLGLPAPMLGFSQFKDASGTASGLELSSTIPFPSKLTNNRSSRQSEAEAQNLQYHLSHKEVLASARLSYYQLWESQQKLTLLLEKSAAIREHLKLATAGARSDNFMKVHLLKTDSDLDLLENDILAAEQTLQERKLILGQMANQAPESFNPHASEPDLSPIPQAKPRQKPLQLEIIQLRVESLISRENEARSGWLPDLNLRYRQMDGTNLNPKFSEFMVGLSLPFVFFAEPGANTSRARAERMQGELQQTQETQRIAHLEFSLRAKALNLKKQLSLITEKLLPKAEKRIHFVHNLAARDLETLQDHREALEAIPELKLKALVLRGQYEETVTELSKYSSEDFK